MIIPATMQEAQNRWREHTKKVAADWVLQSIRVSGLSWCYYNYKGETFPALKIGNMQKPVFVFIKNETGHVWAQDTRF